MRAEDFGWGPADPNLFRMAAAHVYDSYWDGISETKKALKRLGDLESSLGEEMVADLKEESAQSSGEQYRPRAEQTPCE